MIDDRSPSLLLGESRTAVPWKITSQNKKPSSTDLTEKKSETYGPSLAKSEKLKHLQMLPFSSTIRQANPDIYLDVK
ncbi:uncharacterized protein FOMMEDRAFT_132691 [Fomitiporia mediterranea MF3/22]|uniref:uncharacterized protein n=1 Tax=Fomitiporia mediterranea (strain MF3/22) TaxID=694068 RepID=UPI00044074A9|nr:uncharacterized protein FOMMEDRAFT_132691 [Fomitiporia mediterranea MF3/22]EJD04830.1 hypothetical protein FOMMEDRAFT_132691 [Fomitiporia mediterranea MF3/22]